MSGNNKFRRANEKPSISETTERIIVKHRGIFFVIIGALLLAAFAIGITKGKFLFSNELFVVTNFYVFDFHIIFYVLFY